MLFASLEGRFAVEVRHFAKAQDIAERMRTGLHNVLAQLREEPSDAGPRLEDAILKSVAANGQTPGRDIYRRLGKKADEVQPHLDALVNAGELEEAEVRAANGRTVTEYRLPVAEEAADEG